MRKLGFLFAAILLWGGTAAAQPASPAPFQFGDANSYDPVTNDGFPGDEHGALGRTYLVTTTNLQYSFIPRTQLQAGYNPLPAGMPLTAAQFWPTTIDSSKVIVPGATTPPPSGPVGVTPVSDARIIYDPYSPCGDGVGRYITISMGNLTYTGGTTAAAILVGISKGEDPTNSDGKGTNWTFFAIASTAQANIPPVAVGDFPRVGFNTNWIVIVARDFFKDSTQVYSVPLEFVFQRQPSECTAQLPTSPKLLPGASCTGASGNSTSAWYCNNSGLEFACPITNYHSATSDPDGSHFFFITSQSPVTGTVKVSEITGAANSPSYGASTSINLSTSSIPAGSPGANWTWALQNPLNPLFLPQGGTGSMPIQPGGDDDRFLSCISRPTGNTDNSSAIYAAQTVALPNPTTGVVDSTEVQWWTIDVINSGGFGAFITDLERIGGDNCDGNLCYNTMDPSISANSAGDVLIGFSALPVPSLNGGPGYLGAFYTYKSHSGCVEYQPYFYAGGLGPYYPKGDSNGNPARTGDYGQTVVDPLDDSTFWTTEGWAGAPIPPSSGGGYSWLQAWASVQPSTPPAPQFIARIGAEDECPATETNCKVTLTAPPGSQAGDIFITTLTNGVLKNAVTETPVIPAGWLQTEIYFSSQGLFQQIPWNCGCDFCGATAVFMHEYTGTSDPGSYLFKWVRNHSTCGGVHSELEGDLVSYRGACHNLKNSHGDYQISLASAWANSPPTVGPLSPGSALLAPPAGDNLTLLSLFYGAAEADDSNGNCSVLSNLMGMPALTIRSLTNGCTDIPLLVGDFFPAQSNETLGPYTVQETFPGLGLGIATFLQPY